MKADSLYADLKWASVEGVHKNIDKLKHYSTIGSKSIPLKAEMFLLWRVTENFLMASPIEMLKFENISVRSGTKSSK